MEDEYEAVGNVSDEQNSNNPKQKEKTELNQGGEVAKKAAVAAATMYAGKLGGNLVKAASHTQLGKNILNSGGQILNGGNKIVSNINRNPLGPMMPNQSINQNIGMTGNNSMNNPNNLNNSNTSKGLGGLGGLGKFGASGSGISNSKSLFGSGSGKFSFGKNSKMGFMLKLKIYFALGIGFMVMFIICFILIFLDVDMDKMLGTLEWNNEATQENSGVSSDTGFSSDNSSTINNNDLSSLIGEDGIKELENNITTKIGENICTRNGVGASVVALIDGLNKHNLKLPYKEGGRANRSTIVDSSWGVSTDAEGNEVINGLDDKGLILWAMNVSSVNVTDDFDFNIIEDFSTLDDLKPGDIIRGEDIKIVLQNTGSSLIVADATKDDGITYKEYKYEEVTNYSYISMANFYSSNCTN